MIHSKIGASTCERWWNCPGSVALIETLPPQPESPYANEGTAAHELAQKCLETGSNPFAFVGKKSQKGIEFTDEMADAVDVYLAKIYDDIKDTFRDGLNIKNSEYLQIEHKFHLKHIDPDAFGTNDCNLRQPFGRLRVYDYKHGAGVAVEVENNKQLLYYALGALMTDDFSEIETVIVQPRAQHRDGPVRSWVLTPEDLKIFAEELKVKILETKRKNAPLNCGPWCHKTFCPALSTCPAVRGQVTKAAPEVFAENPKPLVSPETMTLGQLKKALDIIPLLDAWIKSVEAHTMMLAQRGSKIEGYKLVRKRANRRWINAEEVEKTLKGHGDEIYSKELKSPAQMEKLLGKKVVQPLTETPEGGIVLVSENDPRDEVQISAIGVFDEVKPTNPFEIE